MLPSIRGPLSSMWRNKRSSVHVFAGIIICLCLFVWFKFNEHAIRKNSTDFQRQNVEKHMLITSKDVKQINVHTLENKTYCLHARHVDIVPNSGRKYTLKQYRGKPKVFQVKFIYEPSLVDIWNATFLVFVQSGLDHFYQRQKIRMTWGNPQWYKHLHNFTIKVIFVYGLPENTDNATAEYMSNLSALECGYYKDVLVGNFIDSYDNLTIKGLVALDWIDQKLPHIRHVFKTDDDIFVNIFGWYAVIQKLNLMNDDNFIAGFIWARKRVSRTWKHALTRKEYPVAWQPAFCSGSGYLMTNVTVGNLLDGVSKVRYVKKDDPYFTGHVSIHQDIRVYSLRHHYLKLKETCRTEDISFENTLQAHRLNYDDWKPLMIKFLKQAKNSTVDAVPILLKRNDTGTS